MLEPQGCPGLCEGDLIVEINQQGLQGLNHSQVVQILKDCAVGTEATLVVQRVAGTGMSVFLSFVKDFFESHGLSYPLSLFNSPWTEGF